MLSLNNEFQDKWSDINENTDVQIVKSSKIQNLTHQPNNYSYEGWIEMNNHSYWAVASNYLFILKQKKKKIEFIIDFNQYVASIIQNLLAIKPLSDSKFLLSVGSYQFLFITQNCKSWIQSLNYYISTASLQNTRLPFEKFWTQHTQTFKEFLEQAETLDIILFRSKAISGQLQRLFTSCEYDHVALLLRNNQNKLHIFEANSDDGVCIYSWEALTQTNFQSYVEQIAYRKLSFKRDFLVLLKLQEFIKKNHGKQYSLSLTKLLKKHSIAGIEKTDYFCSELVASCYKEMGLIDGHVSACQFWPKDFAKDLILQNAELSHEIIIYNTNKK